MIASPRWAAALSLLLVVALLAGCGPAQRGRVQGPDALERGRADQEAPMDRVERLLGEGRIFEAEEALAYVPVETLNARQRHRFRLLRAELSLEANTPLSALRDLPDPNSTPDRALAARTEALRARILEAMGDVAGAVAALITRESLLDDRIAVSENRDRIWGLLMEHRLEAQAQAGFSGAERVAQGWFELALIARGAVPGEKRALLSSWRARYPNHPAAVQRAQEALQRRPDSSYVQAAMGGDIAILLPESGRFSTIASSVRDGFIAAWQSRPEPKPRLRFYDSGEEAAAIGAVVDRALADGAQLIVGPLRKEHVNALSRFGRLPVPVIALNKLSDNAVPPRNLLQYGLAPEDEARAAMRHAARAGHGHMVALLTNADWSARITRTLQQTAEAEGGAILETRFIEQDSGFTEPVRMALNIDASQARYDALVRALGTRPEFEARPRGDAQSLFFVAREQAARQIAPRFAYFGAGELPVYTTALAWDGAIPVHEELRGLRLCDMPWMMQQPDAEWAPLRAQLAEAQGARFQRFPRLFALGHDALLLALRVQQGWASGEAFPGATGFLQLRPDGHIERELGCATLTAEGAEPLPMLQREYTIESDAGFVTIHETRDPDPPRSRSDQRRQRNAPGTLDLGI
ncbi:penicillin-binding protein activator [Algiphilus sp. NNCM1]|nr:penicillin-binding protein activator [Algiphilus acroporae]MCI5061638.1 penicillin-binding protein activator [Algiphilus sp.]